MSLDLNHSWLCKTFDTAPTVSATGGVLGSPNKPQSGADHQPIRAAAEQMPRVAKPGQVQVWQPREPQGVSREPHKT